MSQHTLVPYKDHLAFAFEIVLFNSSVLSFQISHSFAIRENQEFFGFIKLSTMTTKSRDRVESHLSEFRLKSKTAFLDREEIELSDELDLPGIIPLRQSKLNAERVRELSQRLTKICHL